MPGWILAVMIVAFAFGDPPVQGQGVATDGTPEAGISQTLAQERVQRISDLRYNLSFSIPAERQALITGHATISFTLGDPSRPLAIDFDPNRPNPLHRVEAAGRTVVVQHVNGHIVVPASVKQSAEFSKATVA